MNSSTDFKFDISLSVLNHLGRNLYRNFITVVGEAISNSWDADAGNVWIYIDRDNGNFAIKDDGDGMTATDFQDKFLTIGYSKRKTGQFRSGAKERPFIGAKGIGKLALLSCAKKINIITKTESTDYVGGVIDNEGLDEAIKQELKPDQYPLGTLKRDLFKPYIRDHKKGTIIYFEEMKEDIRNTVPYLKKLIALYFRFSLIDSSFKIYVNDELVSPSDVQELSDATEFLWILNEINDPYVKALSRLKADPITLASEITIRGFLATVVLPKDLKITGTEEKIGVDLFVNGRLRERDLMKHIPTARVVESYLYGQVHFDELDSDGKDRFTSSRESVLANDEKYKALLSELKNSILPKILDQWDELRLSREEDGDDENSRKSKKSRKALSLYKLASEDYLDASGGKGGKTNTWIRGLRPDAEFNIPAYVDCFLSENLIRKYVSDKGVSHTTRSTNEITEYKELENKRKADANISFDISSAGDLGYLGMDTLAHMVDGEPKQDQASLARDAIEYKPVRNAVGHTALLTDEAKRKLTIVYENIRARINTLLKGE